MTTNPPGNLQPTYDMKSESIPHYVEQDSDGSWYVVFTDGSTGSVRYDTKEDAEAIMGNLLLSRP